MCFRFLAVFVMVEFIFLISGVPEELRQSICKSYENQGYEKMYDEILKMRDRVLAKEEVDPCVFHMKYITGYNVGAVDVQIDVMTGDFGDNEGYELIIDETVTIDIPAIIKCVIKLKKPSDMIRYKRPHVVYYMVMHGTVGNFDFEKALMANTTSEKDVSVFILEESVLTAELLQSYKYKIREFKSPIKIWFQRKQNKTNKIKELCESFSSFGKSKESFLGKPKESSLGKQKKSSFSEWEVISGRVEIGPKILRITNDTEIELIGIIVCKVSIRHNEETTIENEYFTLSKYEKKDRDKEFVGIYGPIKVDDKQIFAFEPELLNVTVT